LQEALKKMTITSNTNAPKWKEYVQYRLEQYAEVIKTKTSSSPSSSSSHDHIYAQALYHLGRAEAQEVYEKMLQEAKDDDDDDNDCSLVASIATNLLAVKLSQSIPYGQANNTNEDETATIVEQLLEHNSTTISSNEDRHDLLLNRFLLHSMASPFTRIDTTDTLLEDKSTRQRLHLAQACVKDTWKGCIRYQVPYYYLQDDKSAAYSPSLQAVVQHNHALAMGEASPRAALEELLAMHQREKPQQHHFTILQQRIATYNIAYLQAHCGLFDECKKTCQIFLISSSSSNSNSSKQSSQLQQFASMAHALWWQARAAVLLQFCEVQQQQQQQSNIDDSNNNNNKSSLVQTTLQQLQALSPVSAVGDDAILYLQLHLSAFNKSSSTGSLLTRNMVPLSLQSTVGVQWALNDDNNNNNQVDKNGDWYMAHKQYEQAVQCYEEELDNGNKHDDSKIRLIKQAKLVRALSKMDPKRAIQMWSKLKPSLPESAMDENEVNGAQLEQAELPRRIKTRSKTAAAMPSAMSSSTDSQTTKPKKSHNAILRRRARQREHYLQKLVDKNLYRMDRPVTADPERWVPKYERAYNRKRRNHSQQQQQHRSAQGTVSDKDMQKLDVVARQQQRSAGTGSSNAKSTAHLTVAGGGGGGASKKQGSHRR
jgi:hypothetical protein